MNGDPFDDELRRRLRNLADHAPTTVPLEPEDGTHRPNRLVAIAAAALLISGAVAGGLWLQAKDSSVAIDLTDPPPATSPVAPERSADCGDLELLPEGVDATYEDMFWFGGAEYVRDETNDGVLSADDLGSTVAVVCASLSSQRLEPVPGSPVANGVATIRPIGAEIREISGSLPSTRLGVERNDEVLVYARRTTGAGDVGQVTHLTDDVVELQVMDRFSGTQQIASISDPVTVATLVEGLRDAPDRSATSAFDYQIRFVLGDGTSSVRRINLATGPAPTDADSIDDVERTVTQTLLGVDSLGDPVPSVADEGDVTQLFEDLLSSVAIEDHRVEGGAAIATSWELTNLGRASNNVVIQMPTIWSSDRASATVAAFSPADDAFIPVTVMHAIRRDGSWLVARASLCELAVASSRAISSRALTGLCEPEPTATARLDEITIVPDGPYTAGQQIDVFFPADAGYDIANWGPSLCQIVEFGRYCLEGIRGTRISDPPVGLTGLTIELPRAHFGRDGPFTCSVQWACILQFNSDHGGSAASAVLQYRGQPVEPAVTMTIDRTDRPGVFLVDIDGLPAQPDPTEHMTDRLRQRLEGNNTPFDPATTQASWFVGSLCGWGVPNFPDGADQLASVPSWWVRDKPDAGQRVNSPHCGGSIDGEMDGDDPNAPFEITIDRSLTAWNGWLDCLDAPCFVSIGALFTQSGPSGGSMGWSEIVVRALIEFDETDTPRPRPRLEIVEPGPYVTGQTVTVEAHDFDGDYHGIGWCSLASPNCGSWDTEADADGVHRLEVTLTNPAATPTCSANRCYLQIGTIGEGDLPQAVLVVPLGE